MRTPCRNTLHERTYAGTGWRGIPGYLWRALQQGEHFANAGLPPRRCLAMAHALLEAYYPIVFIDCVHMKIHRKRSVETEAFYVVLAVREDKRREVLGIFNKPTESALGWGEMLAELHERGVRKIGLVCADGLKGLEDVISAVFPDAAATLYDAPETQSAELRAQRRQGRAGRGSAAALPYGRPQLYGGEEPGNSGRRSVRNGDRIIAVFDDGRGSGLQSLLHLSELRGKDSVDDLHDELDRASCRRIFDGLHACGEPCPARSRFCC